MKLLPSQTDEVSLAAFGEEARALLMRHDYSGLAKRFGYALAYDRAPSAAIKADFLSAVASPLTVASGTQLPIAVKYFAPNDTGLFAVVECYVEPEAKMLNERLMYIQDSVVQVWQRCTGEIGQKRSFGYIDQA